MKKILSFLFLAALFITPGLSQSIAVSSPAAGKVYRVGDNIHIAWTAVGFTGLVRITLRKFDNSSGYPVKPQHPYNASPVVFTIPDNVVPNQYFIRIRQNDIIGESGMFTINPKLLPVQFKPLPRRDFTIVIPVTSPRQGEQYKRGDSMNIDWNKSPIKKYNRVHINLFKPDGVTQVYTIGSSPPDNTGHYSWSIPHTLPLADYIIKISTPDQKISGKSKVFALAGSGAKPTVSKTFSPHIHNPYHRVHWDNGKNECLQFSGSLPLPVPPAGGTMRVGYRARIADTSSCRWRDWDFLRGILHFDLSQVWGDIKSAELRLKLKSFDNVTPLAGSGATNAYCTSTVEFHRLTGEWSVDNSGFHTPSELVTQFFDYGQGQTFDVTNLVKNAIKGSKPYILEFMFKGPSNQEKTYVSNNGDTRCIKYFHEISLVIEYVPYL